MTTQTTSSDARIATLPPTLINQIAAGEVIERPASVLKELLENALDAGAERVDVTIEDAGRGLIRVVDDGRGIAEADLPLAVRRHATSKIREAADLTAIGTLGFRGEALASVGAVAELEVASRPPEQACGAAVLVRGGDETDVRPDPIPSGTRVEVRNLFYNTPARRKFLKSDRSEVRRMMDEVKDQALGHLEIAFSVTRDGHRILDLPPTSDPRERIAQIHGREMADKLLRFERGSSDLAILGYVSPPHVNRPNRNLQHFVLNGRVIEDKLLYAALREAFRGHLMTRRHPIGFLYLAVEPELVDVNVHPRKAEVRFARPRQIFGTIVKGVREVVEEPPVLPSFDMNRASDRTSSSRSRAAESGASLLRERPEPYPGPMEGGSRTETGADSPTDPGVALQIHDSYLLRETGEGLEIIDQHALHERVLYAEMKERFETNGIPKQVLLVPTVLDLEPEAWEAFETLKESLKKVGLETEPFGDGSVVVRSVPAPLADTPPERLLRGVLETGANEVAEGDVCHDLLATMACKAAVKFGDSLDESEIRALLEKRPLTERHHLCPHGRPTALKITKEELEKRFGRLG